MSALTCNKRRSQRRENGARWWVSKWIHRMRVVTGAPEFFPVPDPTFSTPERIAEAQRLARQRKDDYRPEDDR